MTKYPKGAVSGITDYFSINRIQTVNTPRHTDQGEEIYRNIFIQKYLDSGIPHPDKSGDGTDDRSY